MLSALRLRFSLFLFSVSVLAQSAAAQPVSTQLSSTTSLRNRPPEEAPAPAIQKDNTWLLAGITGGAAIGVLFAGSLSWWNQTGFTGKWTTASEGFFGEQTYAGGSDKLGHLNACYAGTRGMTAIFHWVNVPQGNAALMAAGAVFLLSNGVELADGFSPYGFAYEDAVFNSIGIGLGAVAELYPWFDQYFGIRFAYASSDSYLKMHKGDNFFEKYTQLINDYSGMMFLYDFKIAGLQNSIGKSWLRYFLIGINYSTFEYQPSGPDRQRNLGVHVGLNLADTIKEKWDISQNTLARIGYVVTKYLALPLTNIGISYDLNTNRTQLHVGMAGRFTYAF